MLANGIRRGWPLQSASTVSLLAIAEVIGASSARTTP